MELKAESRSALGKSVKSLRAKGLIPAEFYGRGFPNQTLAISKSDFLKTLKSAGESTVITLVVSGEKHASIIHDIQYHPVSGEVIHADFYGVHMDEKITAHVPLEFAGEAPAVKTFGGVLNKAMDEIEVEALPADLPHSLSVDLSSLVELDQSVYVSNIAVPKGVKIMLEPDTVVATVMPPAAEEEPATSAPDVADVKVETDEKKAERQAEKEAEGDKE